MRVTMLLADAAQEVRGKLYILGGGWPVTGPDGTREVRIGGNFEVGRPPGLPPGSDIDCAFTVNVGAIPLAAGRYAWQLWIDGATAEDWQRPFQVRDRS